MSADDRKPCPHCKSKYPEYWFDRCLDDNNNMVYRCSDCGKDPDRKEQMTTPTQKLRQIAEGATPGPWNDNGEHGITQTSHITRDVWNIPRTVEDVTHISTFDPPTVLWLLDMLEEAGAIAKNIHADGCNVYKGAECHCFFGSFHKRFNAGPPQQEDTE